MRRARYKERPQEINWADKLRRYHLTQEAYDALWAKQNGLCAICAEVESDKKFAVDHDRACCPGIGSCGRCVRGLLCMNCNLGVGQFRDDPERLKSAIRYLER